MLTLSINGKSIDGVLGIQTRDRMMVGSDESTELWRPTSKTLPKVFRALVQLNFGLYLVLGTSNYGVIPRQICLRNYFITLVLKLHKATFLENLRLIQKHNFLKPNFLNVLIVANS